jgi:hypothetical protein
MKETTDRLCIASASSRERVKPGSARAASIISSRPGAVQRSRSAADRYLGPRGDRRLSQYRVAYKISESSNDGKSDEGMLPS